ncbi:MAG: four helix bundle protein [Alistipes sp.]|nr:four helix bundle protein [Alistipes sp.]MBR5131738.1 four helix bundle protein [Alistipes sp.]
MNYNKYIIDTKSEEFALHIISLCKELKSDGLNFVLAKQLLRSGTSVGANLRERVNAQSRRDFINKFQIALKEADESAYWLELLYKSGIIEESKFTLLYNELKEIIAIITASLNKLKNNED